MPQEVRLWCIGKDDRLFECAQAPLNLEARLEEWLAHDISILSDDFLVIGRQVETAFGGFIDLLCIDRTGDLVIVELKRDKTPREITAQSLDYASWVNDLSREAVETIAASYPGITSLDKAFKQRFGEELPDSLNEDHRMLIVASKIDPSSERIIKYLSSRYGVNINAVTFHYFKRAEGNEFLARVFLIDPSDVEYQTRTKGSSKRTGTARRSQPWDEETFFAKLAERGSESEMRVARALFAWASEHLSRMTYGSGINSASFIPVQGDGDAWFSPFRVSTGNRAAIVEIQSPFRSVSTTSRLVIAKDESALYTCFAQLWPCQVDFPKRQACLRVVVTRVGRVGSLPNDRAPARDTDDRAAIVQSKRLPAAQRKLPLLTKVTRARTQGSKPATMEFVWRWSSTQKPSGVSSCCRVAGSWRGPLVGSDGFGASRDSKRLAEVLAGWHWLAFLVLLVKQVGIPSQ